MISKLLREETTPEHQQAERNNTAKFIIDHSITYHQYKNLLYKNYIVYNKLEDSISSFIEELPQELKEFVSFDKSQRLKRDLEQLQFDFSKDLDKVGPVFNNQDLNSNHIIGMLYVIEGSMLGGMMIANQLEHCTELSEIEEHHFFGGNPKIHGQRWRKFVKALDTLVLEEKEVRDIIEGAKEAFNYFDKVFATELVI